MQKLALEPEIVRYAVDGVPRDTKVDRGQVNSNLVRSTRREADAKERATREELEQLELGHGVTGNGGVERDAGGVAPVAADRRFDSSSPRARPAAHEREIFPHELPAAQEALQPAMGLVGAGDDEEPRGVAVESMDDPRPRRIAPARDGVREESVDERAVRVPGRRVDDDAGRLVDDEEILVLVHDAQRHLLRHEGGALAFGKLDLQPLSALEAVTLRPPHAVDERLALTDEAFGCCARTDVV